MENVEEIESRQRFIDLKNSLERLEKNRDFKRLILEGYLKENALDSISLLANPSLRKNGDRSGIMEDLIAISNLKYYFMMIKNIGSTAEEDLLNEETDTKE